jgi:hypothetical protein
VTTGAARSLDKDPTLLCPVADETHGLLTGNSASVSRRSGAGGLPPDIGACDGRARWCCNATTADRLGVRLGRLLGRIGSVTDDKAGGAGRGPTYIILLANAIHLRGSPPMSNLQGEVATAAAQALRLYSS